MKKFYYLILIFFASLLLVSNSAQPGVWNAGGGGIFTLLYPQDSIAYKKIQMQSEDIFMQLYKGFATVKGDYYFKNTAKDTLIIKVGYPINNVFENISYSEYVNNVSVDGLYKIKGLVNDKNAIIHEKPNKNNNNWYVWEITFPPNTITKFTIYFLVNTNNAKITQGYNSDEKNAFIYLIETGSLWKSPIENGYFYAQLKDNLSIENTKISSPTSLFFDDKNNTLKFSLSDYGKTPDKNFVITYGKTLNNFNFKEITLKSDNYFTEIDQFSNKDFYDTNFKNFEPKNPYKVNGNSNTVIGLIFYLGIYGIPILLAIITVGFILFLYRKFIKK